MSQCTVPNWNLRHQQRQEQVQGEEGINRSSHVQHNTCSTHHLSPITVFLKLRSNYEVAELIWQNGQQAMNGLGGPPTKPTWLGRSSDTLESIVHQATTTTTSHNQNQNLNLLPHHHDHHNNTPVKMTSMVATSAGKWPESPGKAAAVPRGLLKKRPRVDSDQCGRNFVSVSMQEDQRVLDRSGCPSASVTFCRDNDTTMMTWPSYESPRSLGFKAKTTDEDSASHGGSENQDEDHDNKTETGRSHSSRRTRAATVHNQSERRRRDRINQKMKALQRLVPNACKTDKASMLDEVIDYLKNLQAQVRMMSSMRNVNNMPQMMMPFGMQQHLQMSMLARMAAAGMGAVGLGTMGMGTMLDINSMARATAPPLLHHPSTATPGPISSLSLYHALHDSGRLSSSSKFFRPHSCSLVFYFLVLVQSMNMELYNKMAALYRQQGNQGGTKAMNFPSSAQQSNPVQGD
ncbi:hypothetical protein Pint_16186 [Pistacia integerrima]|uniref:Uncharacterized protein n=1 Tax=Pistacia integerrima TaxID=434235 RepID=A0ACC0ZFR0_9ROSI|nr:hypothetical protein Pint_16186 [Pistacia integerrima]